MEYNDRLEENGNSISWNNYVQESAGMEGITSPEREFDKAWKEMLEKHSIIYRDELTEDMLKELPELPSDSVHEFRKDKEKYISKHLKWKKEEAADDDEEPDMY